MKSARFDCCYCWCCCFDYCLSCPLVRCDINVFHLKIGTWNTVDNNYSHNSLILYGWKRKEEPTKIRNKNYKLKQINFFARQSNADTIYIFINNTNDSLIAVFRHQIIHLLNAQEFR